MSRKPPVPIGPRSRMTRSPPRRWPGRFRYAVCVNVRKFHATIVCAHGGPVPIFPGAGERILGCPWCFNRAKGLPVPKVSTKTEIQDLGPAMIRRKDRDGNHVNDYATLGKVRVGKLKPETSDE